MIAELVTEITTEDMMDASRFSNTTGKRAKLLRMDLGLRQGDVAEMVGIRHPYLSEIESDKARPTADVIAKLAQALHTTTDYLLLLTDDPKVPQDAEPTHISEEAEQAARMIDEMSDKEIRAQALRAVTGIHAHYSERVQKERLVRDLLNLIERSNGVEFRRDVERRMGLIARPANGSGEPPSLGYFSDMT